MQNLVITTEEQLDAKIQAAVQRGFEAAFSLLEFQPQQEDEIGDIEFASRITGKAIPTIYTLCSKNFIPHFKRGKKLYFSKKDLLEWIKAGKRKTTSEIAADADHYLTKKAA